MIKYSKEEEKYLLNHRCIDSTKSIADAVSRIFGTNRAHWSISQKLARLGVKKPRVGNFTLKESALIETFIDNPDINEMVKQMGERFGFKHSRGSLITKRSKLRSERGVCRKTPIQIIADRDQITGGITMETGKTGRAVISTLELAHAMTDAGHSVRSLSAVRDIRISEEKILDMLTRTGVCKQLAPCIRSALDMRDL